mmetsp:Transcript_41841/g.100430  ORF Transcript_41841/g.100430 Transcript_41841/m.100430 type:complete len:363 (+) Transcript_41841:2-1090(+)
MVIAILQLVVFSILFVDLVNGFSVERSTTAASTTKKTTAAAAVETTETSAPNVVVQVWNDVINDETCNSLHEAACQIGLGHRVFSRNMNDDNDNNDDGGGGGPTNNIENIIDDILSELDDKSNFVEYWTRQEWRHIEAHADIDEYLAKRQQQDPFLYPVNGHVLYLQVGEKVRGPTCVFPGRRSGGDLLKDLDQSSSSSSSSPSSSSAVELVTVPAVPGRLLRFQGDYLHAVPRPTDLWFLKFVQGAPQFEPESEWGRSVILFNTWSEPPTEVPISQSTATDNLGDNTCTDRVNWNQESFVDDPGNHVTGKEDPIAAKIWLLGDYKRRDHALQTLKLTAPQSLRPALNETTEVSRIWLHQQE